MTDAPLSSDSFSWVKILAREAKPRFVSARDRLALAPEVAKEVAKEV